MDFVPFTLFFMVCLLSFQGNVLGKPATEADYNKDPLAQKCKKELDDRNYCTQKLTGYGYPSVKELEALYLANIGKIDSNTFRINETANRDSESNFCRQNDKIVSNITMIRDEHGNSRYTLHIPGIFEAMIPVKDCAEDAREHIDRKYRKLIKCVQKSFNYPFFVLSHDKKSLEFVKINGVHSSCEPEIQVNLNEI